MAFCVQGVCFSALVTRIPTLQARFALSEGALAGLLALVPVVAGVGSAAAGALAARAGSRRVLRVMGPVVPISLVAVGVAASMPALVAALLALGIGLGSVDASMNIQGVDAQHTYRRPIMASFYAFFSAAGIVGALLSAAVAGTGMPLGAFFALLALAFVPAQLVAGRHLSGSDVRADAASAPDSASAPESASALPWRPILLIGAAVTCVYVLDSSAANWSAVYLSSVQHSPDSVAALGYAAYALVLVLGRSTTDRLVARTGPAPLVRVGAVVAAVGIAMVVLAPDDGVALAGFAVLGLGAAPAVPLAFSAAASHDLTGSGQAVARVNVFNYVGFLLGAPLVGLVADASSLRWGFAVLVPVALAVGLLAPALRPAQAVEARPATVS